MRRILLGLAVAFGLSAFAPAVHAQGFSAGFSDPFFLYYGFYLPRQAALAAQPSMPNQINDVAASRQNYAVADRAGLYDPAPNQFGMEQSDPLSPFKPRAGAERLPHLPMSASSPRVETHLQNGQFRSAGRYYPAMRPGSFANKNVVGGSHFSRAGSAGYSGGYGMPSAPGR
jgi:hypothetical protein